jgi:hypothetical protein
MLDWRFEFVFASHKWGMGLPPNECEARPGARLPTYAATAGTEKVAGAFTAPICRAHLLILTCTVVLKAELEHYAAMHAQAYG